MNRRHTMLGGITLAAAAAVALLWQKQRSMHAAVPVASEHTRALLLRAVPVLRLPTSPDREADVLPDGTGLRCVRTGQIYPVRDGILDLLADEPTLTETQQALNTHLTAWAYDRSRGALLRVAGAPTFAQEVAMTEAALAVSPGDTVLDLACGPGNFTAAWAERVRPEGLVIGLDLSRPMLRRAVRRVYDARLTNVLLIRGDAERLPFATGAFAKINCSGGFHQFPDLERALGEIARVHTADGVLTASTFGEGPQDGRHGLKRALKRRFALHFVPLDWLKSRLEAVGYSQFRATLPGGWFAYTSARKATDVLHN